MADDFGADELPPHDEHDSEEDGNDRINDLPDDADEE